MIKTKDGYAKLISTSYTGNANYLLKSNGEAWEVHTGRNQEKNKIVRTDASGYLQTGWINTTSGNTTATISRIYCSNDQYIRYQTPAQFFSTLANDTTNNKIYLTIAGQKRELAVNADTLDGLHADSFVPRVTGIGTGVYRIGNVTSAKGVKITLPFTYDPQIAAMFAFTLRCYIGYQYTDIVISGYDYGTNHWYASTAKVIGGTKNYHVVFGYNTTNKKLTMWLGNTDASAFSYGGLSIINAHCGYTGYDMYSGWSHNFCTQAEYEASDTKQSEMNTVLPTEWQAITNKPTTLSGYGITDAASSSHTHYIGTTQVQNSSAAQAVTGITTLTASGTIKSTYAGPAFHANPTSGWAYIRLQSGTGTLWDIATHSNRSYALEFRCNGNNPTTNSGMLLTTDGKLGIGTSSPTYNLHVVGTAYASTSVTSPYFKSTIATGTAPLTVTSTTLVSNLNADMLDNKHLTDIAANGYIMEGYTIDASSLDADTFYPVIMRIPAHKTVRIEIRVGLNSGKPSWATHSLGFSVMKIWEVNGGDWGVAPEYRRILVSTYKHTDIDPVRGIRFWYYSYYEVVYVRGGGKYYFYLSHNVSPSLKSEDYSITDDTGTTSTIPTIPLASAPAAIVVPSLTFNAGTFATKTFYNGSGAVTVNIPTKTSHLTNDSGYLANSVPWSKITDAPTTLKNPNAITIFGVSYDGSEAKTVDKVTFISTLNEGTSNFTDDVMLVTSVAGNTNNDGFNTEGNVNVPYKRKAIYLWNYVKTKTDPLYVTKLGTDGNYLTYTINGTATNVIVPYATTSGNAATTTKLATARKINGTDFDGSAAITTALWGTARNITIGGTTKSVNGSADISWSLSEIGAASSGHNHDGRYVQRLYLDTGGNLTGYTGSYVIGVANLSDSSVYTNSGGCGLDNRSVILHLQGTNGTSSHWNQLYLNYGNVSFRTENATNWRRLAFVDELPTALKSPKSLTIQTNGTSLGSYDGSADKVWNITYSNVGAASSGHNHDGTYLKLTGGTMTGVITSTYTSNTWVNSLTSSVITVNNSGYSGWICGPTKNGRIVISTYAGSDDNLYFGYGETGRTNNSFASQMYWNGPNNLLTIGNVNIGYTNEIYSSSNPLYINKSGRGNQNVLICSGSGNVGIGNTSPSYKLHVTGTLGVSSTSTFAGTMYLPSVGTSYIASGSDKAGSDYTAANVVIRSWWGISFKSYDDVIRTYLDTRTGNIGTKGSITTAGFKHSSYLNDVYLLTANGGAISRYNILLNSWHTLSRPSDGLVWYKLSTIATTQSDNVNNDWMIEIYAYSDQNFPSFTHGYLRCSSFNTGSTSIVLSTDPSTGHGGNWYYGSINAEVWLYATIDSSRNIWLGVYYYYTARAFIRVLQYSSVNAIVTSGWTTTTTNPNTNYITQNGQMKKYTGAAQPLFHYNVVSSYAIQLRTTRTIWGQSFNGTANVTGSILLQGSTSADMTYSGNVHPKLIFQNDKNAQDVALIYTDYDSYRAPSGLKLVGSQGSEWFEVVGNIYGKAFVKSGGTAAQLLRADGGVAAFNWSGQSGQPTWLWGGNSQHTYYVYNPSNFSVNYATSAGNADKLDGYHASINNTASTVVVRDANKYIYATYINSAIGVEDESTPTVFYYSYDTWIRKMSYSRLQTLLNSALKFVKKSDFHVIWAGKMTRASHQSATWSATKLGGEATLSVTTSNTDGRLTLSVSGGTPYQAFCTTSTLFVASSTSATSTYSANSSTQTVGRSPGMGDYMVVVSGSTIYIRQFRQTNGDNDSWSTDGLSRTYNKDYNKYVKEFNLMIIGTSS